MGYLLWVKIPYEYLSDGSLRSFLEQDLSGEKGPYLRTLHECKEKVLEMSSTLSHRGISRIRTGLSWAEWDTPQGPVWISWYMREFSKHFKALPNLTFTPPRKGIEERTNVPPRNLVEYPQFVDNVLSKIGELFDEVELWNEWDLVTDWDSRIDPDYEKFVIMITMGALVARLYRKAVVFGGVSGVKPATIINIESFAQKGLMSYVDHIGFHNLRGTWGDTTPPLPLKTQAEQVREAASAVPSESAMVKLAERVLNEGNSDERLRIIFESELGRRRSRAIGVMVTEYGFPPHDPMNEYPVELLEKIQVALYAYALDLTVSGQIERIYWYTYKDVISPSLRFATTGWEDVLQYYYGDTKEDGRKKLLGELLDQGGPNRVIKFVNDNNLWNLVDKASLARKMPLGYKSQSSRT